MRTIYTLTFLGFSTVMAGLLTSCDSAKPEERTAVKAAPASLPDSAQVILASTEQASVAVTAPIINLSADAAAILAKPQVPILCYHQVRDWRDSDSKQARDYIVPTAVFRDQMQMLADSGYHTILPDQLMAYLTTGAPLPEKPVMITFDDTNLDQYTNALPELEKHNFKAVYFIMTVSLNRPRYMTREQVKELSDKGHAIGSHTWDHHNVKKYEGNDWITQVAKPKKVLEEITGKPVTYFAYPFGLWNKEAIPELKNNGMTAAFQLAAKRDEQDPLFTIRRIIASGYWSPIRLYKNLEGSF
ncbi:peptidoglycan/xylan/chitin deacetylase (PgdA/CDA1 family) [Pontibacter aydingkolensis]|uniref:Polysaccharide deacetylase family protein n=1 Tax=Pontibacter aydingkolensis TaxID=1911536 RepID=A0ABS7CVL4_9BACT|nr:polysaccharide deacetylase family protein [Pontibacter aydingkolensis]MBW7467901.1 polysaccharide deacetylase family protein [Pontibacter aydingkolensis]